MMPSDHAATSPTLRATFSPSGLLMTSWQPFLIQCGGRYGSVIREGGASPAVFDLTIEREANEDGIWLATDLFVTEVVAAEDETPRRTLLSWATGLDYRRVWWGHEVTAIESVCALGGTWRSRCPTCGSDWSDDTYSFWITARGAGFFPLDCVLCGHALPQSAPNRSTPAATGAHAMSTHDAADQIVSGSAGR